MSIIVLTSRFGNVRRAIVFRRHIRTAFAFVLLSLIAGLLQNCTRDDRPTVVVYVSADEHIARQVFQSFETRTGIRVRMLGDTEATKTTGLVERLRAERKNPHADVFWSSEIFQTITLAEEGILAPTSSDPLHEWPSPYKDADGRWHAFAARARVIVYAPDRVPPDEIPRTWMDLTRPPWKGRIAMADPRFGTTGGHLAAMKVYWDRNVGPGFYEAFLQGLAYNDVRILTTGNAGVVDAVARGEADAGMTDTDDVWAAKARGLTVEIVYPAHDIDREAPGTGTLLIPNTVARVTGGANPSQALALIEFLLSPDTELLLAKSVSHNVPLRPGLDEQVPQYCVPNPLQIDYAQVAARRIGAVETAMRLLREREPLPTPRQEGEGDHHPSPSHAQELD